MFSNNNSNLAIVLVTVVLLSSIVIFSSLDTPDSAQLATFGNNVSNVTSAIIDQLTGVSVNYAVNNQYRNTEQIYFTLATGLDAGQKGAMIVRDPKSSELKDNILTLNNKETANDKNCQRIIPEHAAKKSKEGGLGYSLPYVRESNAAWYVTEEGQVFNATGFVMKGKTYFTASLYYNGELKMTSSDKTNTYSERAQAIAEALLNGESGAVELTGNALTK